ncbi:MAG: zinc-ribbon domain containing protein [Chloroflexi bacterium]|nr:zinc-ribbon domain containing protein [Chloroflexota bacterium]
MAYTDKSITCVNCGEAFTFSASEQETFAARGYTNEPKRCPTCRASRRSERPGGDGDSYGSGGYGAPRQMYQVVCASCGQTASVPFEPRGTRPVYCNDCYQRTRPSRY